MNLFEFLMVLVSIIIGLGITEILAGVARVIRCRDTVRTYFVHTVLTVTIFVAHLQIWWESWGLQRYPEWNFLGLVMMLSGPVCLFLMAHLLFPEELEGADLREYYYGAMQPFWWLAALGVVTSTTFRPIVFGEALLNADNATSLALLIGFLVLVRTRRPTIHAVLVPAFLLLLLVDILQWNSVIGLG